MLRVRLIAALSIPFGFVLGHVVGFGLGHPDAADRVVAEAGHEYLASLADAAVPLLLLSLTCALLAGARRVPLRPRVLPTALQLSAVFATVELIEHLTSGWPVEHVLREPSLWLGLLTQVAVATAVVGLIRLLVRVGARLTETTRPPGRPARAVATFPVLTSFGSVALTPIRRRGPPPRSFAVQH